MSKNNNYFATKERFVVSVEERDEILKGLSLEQIKERGLTREERLGTGFVVLSCNNGWMEELLGRAK